jgi:diguanylate cyclase (GGDEF) domain
MHEIQDERTANLTFMIFCTLICVALAQVGAMVFVNTIVVKPLNKITKAVKKFDPKEGMDYKEAGVMDLDIKNRDEIGTIYNEIRSQQIRIVDYVRSVTDIRRDKEMTEADLRKKKVEVGRISEEAYKDALTGVGSKTAYNRKIIELTALMEQGFKEFAIVVMDVNRLKFINDTYGHSIGDELLKIYADKLKAICGTDVFAAKIGGDEFGVILNEKFGQKELMDFTSTVAKIFSESVALHGDIYSVTVSIGAAVFPTDSRSAELLFRCAETAMFSAKANGKNQLFFYAGR